MGFVEELARRIGLSKTEFDSETKLAKNFKLGEFACNDKQHTQVPEEYFENVVELAENLQVIRDHVGSPITVISGYRTPEHNKTVGGVKNSQHLLAKAADIQIKDLSTDVVYDSILTLIKQGKIKQGGVGHYPNRFVHYDIRGKAARWTGKGR